MKTKFLKTVIAGLLVLALLPGCSSDEDKAAESDTSVATTAKAPAATAPTEAEIKEIYKLSDEDMAKHESENSPKPITYGGFTGKFFSTPVTDDSAALMTITPMYSHKDVHNYMQTYSATFDLGEGDGSFAASVESYGDEYFREKALLVISFLDREGGDNYQVVGGWDDHVVGEGFELDRFVVGTKKTDGDITAAHVIVEIDNKFLSIWDSFGMEIYK